MRGYLDKAKPSFVIQNCYLAMLWGGLGEEHKARWALISPGLFKTS